jgi:glycosyltransferase involved in cell wall biosynthesis
LIQQRILFVIASLAMGGSERQLAMLATSLATKGWPVKVFVLEGGGSLQDELRRAGVEVAAGGFDAHASLPLRVATLARAQWRLGADMLRWRATVVHAFLPLAGLLAVVAGRLCRVPRVIVARRALGTHQERHPYWGAVDRFVDKLADIITANSWAVADDTARREGVPASKIRVIPNGIESSRFEPREDERRAVRSDLGLHPDNIAVVCLANLIPYKGHRDLLAAFARVAQRRPQARLFLVGADRGMGASLQALAADLGIASRVVQLGHRDDIAPLLGAMDLGVLASHEEGLPNAILEYLAAGLPVVATEVGGTAEALAGVPGCRLVKARDIEGLAAALIDLLPEASNRELGSARRQSVTRRFSVDAMVQRHLELYGLVPTHAGT